MNNKYNNSFEYISSGASHARIHFAEIFEAGGEETKEFVEKCFHNLNTFSKNHKFSLLVNAWTEPLLALQYNLYKPSIHQLMMDSGGLQIITQGLSITDEMKDEIYLTMAHNCDTAMSFDEIPLSFDGTTSDRLDTSNRYFDITKFEECAKQTGKNLARQIEIFLEEESATHPHFIAQGNNLDTFCRWTEIALKEIPKEHHKHIQGIAMGSPALGTGPLEDIKKAFYFTQLPLDVDTMHILGVGAVSRMKPFIILAQYGTYKDLYISYDSTTHASGVNFGRYYMNGNNIKFPRIYDPVRWGNIYKDVQNNGMDYGQGAEMFSKAFSMPSRVYEKKYGDRYTFVHSVVGLYSSAIKNFIKETELCFADKSYLINTTKNIKEKNTYAMLYKINTIEDYIYWEKEVGRHIESKAVASSKKQETNLEDIF